jgi:hypothetical protein
VILQIEQWCPGGPLIQRWHSTESDMHCRYTKVCVTAECSSNRMLVGPEHHRTCVQFGAALYGRCAECRQAAHQLFVRGGVNVVIRGSAGYKCAEGRWTQRGRARKRAMRATQKWVNEGRMKAG